MNEKNSVIPNGTSIHNSSIITAGACNNLGSVRLAMGGESLDVGICFDTLVE